MIQGWQVCMECGKVMAKRRNSFHNLSLYGKELVADSIEHLHERH